MELSVVIITFNEEEHIARCIRSVEKIADEIIVVDSFSTDSTISIARANGALVHSIAFKGYIHQKNVALTFASNNFVLSLDADEELSEELVQSLIKAKTDLKEHAYRMNRRAFYCGKYISHGTWYPEPKVRLFDKRYVRWGGLDPHDRIIYPTSMKVGRLKGDIIHYICKTVHEHKRRNELFSTIAAKTLYDLGKNTNWFKIIGSPLWFFFFDYIIRGGFLNGKQGWWIATNQMNYHYLKYLKLYRMRRGR